MNYLILIMVCLNIQPGIYISVASSYDLSMCYNHYSDDYTLQVNPNSSKHMKDHLEYFKFIGRILGMAIHHKVIIDG